MIENEVPAMARWEQTDWRAVRLAVVVCAPACTFSARLCVKMRGNRTVQHLGTYIGRVQHRLEALVGIGGRWRGKGPAPGKGRAPSTTTRAACLLPGAFSSLWLP